MSSRARHNGLVDVLYQPLAALHVCFQVPLVCHLVSPLAKRYSHEEDKIAHAYVHEDRDLGPAAQGPSCGKWGVGLGLEQDAVHDGAVGRLVFQHQDGVLVEVYAEMDIAQAAMGVVLQADVGSGRVAAKGEALEGVLDLGREAQGHMVFADVLQIEVLGVIF